MRALCCSFWAYFISYFIWFSIAPLLSEIRYSLQLSRKDIYDASVIGLCGTIASRVLLGPLCDWFGARLSVLMVLLFASSVAAMTGVVNSYAGLAALRFFLGFAGGVFVM